MCSAVLRVVPGVGHGQSRRASAQGLPRVIDRYQPMHRDRRCCPGSSGVGRRLEPARLPVRSSDGCCRDDASEILAFGHDMAGQASGSVPSFPTTGPDREPGGFAGAASTHGSSSRHRVAPGKLEFCGRRTSLQLGGRVRGSGSPTGQQPCARCLRPSESAWHAGPATRTGAGAMGRNWTRGDGEWLRT